MSIPPFPVPRPEKKSASSEPPDLATEAERLLVQETVRVLALLDRNRQIVELGAYESGSNPELDAALSCRDRLLAWLRQAEGGVPRAASLRDLADWQAEFAKARLPTKEAAA